MEKATGCREPAELRERLEKEAGKISFVHGTGHRRSAEQKEWERLEGLLKR